MQKAGVRPDTSYLYNTLIEHLTFLSMEKAKYVYDSMVKGEIKNRFDAGKMMVRGYCRQKDIAGAIAFLNSLPMNERGYVLYKIVIQGAITEGEIGTTMSLYNELVSIGSFADDILLTRIASSLIRRGLYQELCTIIPDIKDLYAIELELSACFKKWFKKGQKEQVEQIFNHLHIRTTTLYNCLIEQYFILNEPRKALQLIINMGKENIPGDETTFNIVLQYDPNIESVEALLHEFNERGFIVHAQSAAAQISTLLSRKRYKDAKTVLDAVQTRDSRVYKSLLYHAIENHDTRRTEDLFGLMHGDGLLIPLEFFKKMEAAHTKKLFFNKMVEKFGVSYKRQIKI